MRSSLLQGPRALLVEDDQWLRGALQERLTKRGFAVAAASTVRRARELIEEGGRDLLLLDLNLPDADGIELIDRARSHGTRDVIVMSGYGDAATVSSVFRSGAVDFLPKPLDLARLDEWLVRAAQRYRGDDGGRPDEPPLLGRSSAFTTLMDDLRAHAAGADPVVLSGASGVGKSRLARELHRAGRAPGGRLVALQGEGCTPADFTRQLEAAGQLLPSDRQRPTLLVEEFTLLSPVAQAVLASLTGPDRAGLAWAEQRGPEFARVLLTSSVDPAEEAREARLRADLWMRVAPSVIRVPSLAERDDDVVHIIQDTLARERPGVELAPAVAAALVSASWPGNVRQAVTAARRAGRLDRTVLSAEDFGLSQPPAPKTAGERLEIPIGTSLEDARRRLILATLEAAGGDKARAAEVLGISLKTLYNRIREYRASD